MSRRQRIISRLQKIDTGEVSKTWTWVAPNAPYRVLCNLGFPPSERRVKTSEQREWVEAIRHSFSPFPKEKEGDKVRKRRIPTQVPTYRNSEPIVSKKKKCGEST